MSTCQETIAHWMVQRSVQCRKFKSTCVKTNQVAAEVWSTTLQMEHMGNELCLVQTQQKLQTSSCQHTSLNTNTPLPSTHATPILHRIDQSVGDHVQCTTTEPTLQSCTYTYYYTYTYSYPYSYAATAQLLLTMASSTNSLTLVSSIVWAKVTLSGNQPLFTSKFSQGEPVLLNKGWRMSVGMIVSGNAGQWDSGNDQFPRNCHLDRRTGGQVMGSK